MPDDLDNLIRENILTRRRARVAVQKRIAELAESCTDLATLTRAYEVLAEAEMAEDALSRSPGA